MTRILKFIIVLFLPIYYTILLIFGVWSTTLLFYMTILTSITIQHPLYILSLPSYTCPRTIRWYVAKSQGRRQHVGSGRKRRFHRYCPVIDFPYSSRSSWVPWTKPSRTSHHHSLQICRVDLLYPLQVREVTHSIFSSRKHITIKWTFVNQYTPPPHIDYHMIWSQDSNGLLFFLKNKSAWSSYHALILIKYYVPKIENSSKLYK